MVIRILKKGDRVINVTQDFIAVQRKNGEVDIISIVRDNETLRIDPEATITIGYGDNVVQTDAGDVTITTF